MAADKRRMNADKSLVFISVDPPLFTDHAPPATDHLFLGDNGL
jgi:hypothetical protein